MYVYLLGRARVQINVGVFKVRLKAYIQTQARAEEGGVVLFEPSFFIAYRGTPGIQHVLLYI
jgi:hypothetical protein